LAVFGRMAAAASWSESQEERRKALYSNFRQGVAVLAWDNIKAGTEIACPEIEKALTGPTIRDRVLSVSRTETALTTTIQLFTGNNVRFAGDMASRGVEIRLTTDEPRPEDRPVRHADPLRWTLDHRAQILRCLYTILIYGCRNRPTDLVAKTRFREWWRLCGWPVELASSLAGDPLDFIAAFKATEEQDSTVAGVVSALNLLRAEFGSIERGKAAPTDADAWFRARQIREAILAGETARALLKQDPKEQAKVDRANRFLEMYEELHGKRHLSPVTNQISAVLGKIVDRPVNLDDTTIGILRAGGLDGNRRFRVETHTTGADHGISVVSPATIPEVGSPSHFPPEEHNPLPQSGMITPLPDPLPAEPPEFHPPSPRGIPLHRTTGRSTTRG
jgi:hypothetical protein